MGRTRNLAIVDGDILDSCRTGVAKQALPACICVDNQTADGLAVAVIGAFERMIIIFTDGGMFLCEGDVSSL